MAPHSPDLAKTPTSTPPFLSNDLAIISLETPPPLRPPHKTHLPTDKARYLFLPRRVLIALGVSGAFGFIFGSAGKCEGIFVSFSFAYGIC
ncbi:hypothetical protein CC78DRAFT_584749 [Lojkania enalia]|uniref:Uncharacterized protein n=1 Tax=Lojkania enalia TaxID=147567 RepID=A0A9P4MZM9_9PLEO|nr:hypothetical protein CC78DRAFT_584749 [Didymosphaeria enalia]